MLHEFLSANREELIARTRQKVASRPAPRATLEELTNGPPLFLEQLIQVLRLSGLSSEAIGISAAAHGGDMLRMGFTVGQVVHGYGDVCQAVTELADETEAPIATDEFHTLNRCLDDAIAGAVTEYMHRRERSIADAGTERLGALAHEMRNRLATAMLAFDALKRGSVGVSGSTGAMLGRNLIRLRQLVDVSLAEVRLEAGLVARERVSVSDFIEEIGVDAALEATARGVELRVAPAPAGVDLDVDRSLLAASVANLLQNAFKFTRPGGRVSLSAVASGGRVLIEIEDQCGGLPPGRIEELFRPFTQRSADRTGLGLGLSISRKGVEANGGQIGVRNLPGSGCVFSIDLPAQPTP